MKKPTCLIGVLVLTAVVISGCVIPISNDVATEKIVFPFAASDVKKIEIYKMMDSVPPEIKTVTVDSDIEYLYTYFTELSVENKMSSSNNIVGTVKFVFYLEDRTTYDLKYRNIAVKDGRLQSKYFDYFTSSDVMGVWDTVSGEISKIPSENATVQ